MEQSRPAMARSQQGFSLLELMVTLVIIGVLAAIAYPSYLRHVRTARRTDALTALSTMAATEERYYSDNNTYTTAYANFSGIVDSSGMLPDGYYKITIAAGPSGSIATSYLLTATAQHAQTSDLSQCQTITLNSAGAKGDSTSSPAGAAVPNSVCWAAK